MKGLMKFMLILSLAVPVLAGCGESKEAHRSDYGMELGKRWHYIHNEALGIKCGTCHISKYEDDYLYQRKYKVPVRGAPGVVKREVCLPCHGKNGLSGKELYATGKTE